MLTKLTFLLPIYEQMIEYGMKSLPSEACGILSGKENKVRTIWPLQNELDSTKRFFVSEKAVLETLQQIDVKNEEVLAVYHTHPLTKPTPSYYDMIYHSDESVIMVIISYRTTQPLTRCFRIDKAHLRYEECLFSIDPYY